MISFVTSANLATRRATIKDPASRPSGEPMVLLRSRGSFAAKCVATAMVLLTGVTFGRQVLSWWGVEEPPAAAPPAFIAASLGESSEPHCLQFGDQSWTIYRKCVGSRELAARALRSDCRRLVRSSISPEGLPGKAEEGFLAFLAGSKPIEQEPGNWQLYELDAALPMVAGTHTSGEPGVVRRDNVTAPGRRVTTWGMAIPATENLWTVYTFQSGSTVGDPARRILLPPGSRRTLSVQTAEGSEMIVFTGHARIKAWMQHFDRWFQRRGWTVTSAWQHTDDRWSARFGRPKGEDAGSVDVHFALDDPKAAGSPAGAVLPPPGKNPLPLAAELREGPHKHQQMRHDKLDDRDTLRGVLLFDIH